MERASTTNGKDRHGCGCVAGPLMLIVWIGVSLFGSASDGRLDMGDYLFFAGAPTILATAILARALARRRARWTALEAMDQLGIAVAVGIVAAYPAALIVAGSVGLIVAASRGTLSVEALLLAVGAVLVLAAPAMAWYWYGPGRRNTPRGRS